MRRGLGGLLAWLVVVVFISDLETAAAADGGDDVERGNSALPPKSTPPMTAPVVRPRVRTCVVRMVLA